MYYNNEKYTDRIMLFANGHQGQEQESEEDHRRHGETILSEW